MTQKKIYNQPDKPTGPSEGDLWKFLMPEGTGVVLEYSEGEWRPWGGDIEMDKQSKEYLVGIDVIHVAENQLVEIIRNYRELGYMVAVEPNRDRVNNGLTGITTYTTSYKITVYRKEDEANE